MSVCFSSLIFYLLLIIAITTVWFEKNRYRLRKTLLERSLGILYYPIEVSHGLEAVQFNILFKKFTLFSAWLIKPWMVWYKPHGNFHTFWIYSITIRDLVESSLQLILSLLSIYIYFTSILFLETAFGCILSLGFYCLLMCRGWFLFLCSLNINQCILY